MRIQPGETGDVVDEQASGRLYDDVTMAQLLGVGSHIPDSLLTKLSEDDPVVALRRAAAREVFLGETPNTLTKLDAAARAACYYHDTYAACKVRLLVDERQHAVASGLEAKPTADDCSEMGVWLTALIAMESVADADSEVVDTMLEVLLPFGLRSRPGHTFSILQNMYKEAGIHRIALSRIRRRKSRERFLMAVERVEDSLAEAAVRAFTLLGNDANRPQWLGHSTEDDELLRLDSDTLRKRFLDLKPFEARCGEVALSGSAQQPLFL